MRAEAAYPEQVELSIVRPENLVLVENQDGAVVIRTVREDFSPQEKEFWVRYLAAEGYIPEFYQWSGEPDSEWSRGLTWIAGGGGLRAKELQNKALRDVLRLLGCAGLVWLALMVFAFLHAPH
jgi:hypothetical protein